jgi:3-hydroxyisobutyrate dehydrogenase-like beta-hydroxyacid dehydrogenase
MAPSEKKPVVGVVGVGRMGYPLARNLLSHGFPVVVAGHRNPEPVAALASKGAIEAAGVGELAARSDVVLLVVPGASEVEALVISPGEITSSARPGSIVVDMTTNHPDVVSRCAAVLATCGVRMLDAPMSRGVPAAEAGTLLLQVGGDAITLAAVRPVLEAVASDVLHMGPLGAGMTAKIVNNLKALSEMPLIEEALRLGVCLGLDPERLAALFQAGSADSFMVRTHVPRILGRDPRIFATVDTVLKDLELALRLATTVDVPLPMTAAARQVYAAARDQGLGQSDLTAAVKVFSPSEAAVGSPQ